MLLGKYVEHDLDFPELAKDIGASTNWGTNQLITYFKSCVEDPDILESRRNVVLKLRQHLRKNPDAKVLANKLLQRAGEIEKALDEKVTIEDQRVQEYYAQILWEKDSFVSFLNENPYWMEICNLWKVWVLPAITILIPVMIVVIPFIILRFVLSKDLSVQEYWTLLQQILAQNGGQGNMISGMLLPPWIQTGGTTSQIAQRWVQWGASVFMFGSSIWQQITLSRHLHTITEDMRKRGSLIIELHEIRKQLADIIGPAIQKYMDLPSDFDLPGENTLQIFGYTWNNPSVIEKVTTMIGKLDVMVTCASLRKIGFPTYAVNSDKTDSRLYIENFFHPHLLRENKKNVIITNTLDLHKGNTFNHALVTGPNRGGKSTSLKSILTNVVLAQSLGICFAKKMEFTPFKQIHTALSPSDTLGRLSLFETEIEFAKEILENLTKEDAGRALLVMDEIFHSTNAIDGEEASKIFLERLYQLPVHMSLISTHYIKLPETYTERKLVESLCLTAKKGPEDTLIYSYKMKKGINSLSSVREILKERGLL